MLFMGLSYYVINGQLFYQSGYIGIFRAVAFVLTSLKYYILYLLNVVGRPDGPLGGVSPDIGLIQTGTS